MTRSTARFPIPIEIAEVISRIKAGGYDVFVVLEATIGFNQQRRRRRADGFGRTELSSAEFEMTSQDLKFLKSLRISVGKNARSRAAWLFVTSDGNPVW